MKTHSSADYRRALAARLRERADELAEAIFDRICSLEGVPEQPGRTFGGLRPLIRSLVEYGAVAIECDERQCPPPPPAALENARKAAWAGVSAQLLHRHYLAAHSVFNHFLRREARTVEGYDGDTLSQIQGSNDVVFERLSHQVGEEFAQEVERKRRSTATQKLERVKALLAGELIEAPDLGYEFDATHIGIVASGEGLNEPIKHAAKSLGGRLLLVQPSPQKVWAWVSTRSDASACQLKDLLTEACPPSAQVTMGEPASGLVGWRHTHREAQAALKVVIRLNQSIGRYAEVSLIAAILSNDLLPTSLERDYLAPLARERDGGRSLRRTLRAYFSASRNGRAAAAALGVTPQTVTNRLRRVEARLGLPMWVCGLELEAALRVADLLQQASSPGS